MGQPVSGFPIKPVVSSSTEASHILAPNACALHGFQVNSTTVSGWVMLIDSATVPGDGAVTPLKWWQIGANTTLGVSYSPPISLLNGVCVVFSTTGPFTKTGSATATFSGEAR